MIQDAFTDFTLEIRSELDFLLSDVFLIVDMSFYWYIDDATILIFSCLPKRSACIRVS
jgi:hypothetical protein